MKKYLLILLILLTGLLTLGASAEEVDINIVETDSDVYIPMTQQSFEENFPIEIDESGLGVIERDPMPVPTAFVPEAVSEAEAPIGESLTAAYNPMTGQWVKDASLLSVPPVFVPVSRYPSTNRPTYGTNSAAWVFEMYVSDEESRPVLMFYGDLPEGEKTQVSRVSSAIYGLEALRLQYGGMIIAGGTSQSILDAGVLNMETWYGTDGNQKYPVLPAENLRHIVEKWIPKATPADPNNMVYAFNEDVPEGGENADSLMVRYASNNTVLWKYEGGSGRYYRSQNSVEEPGKMTEDQDMNDGSPVGADNIVILMAAQYPAPVNAESNYLFNPELNYVPENPALILRDGKLFRVTWTTKSESFEVQSNRMRPIRFYNADGSQFEFKPGRTWVHIVTLNSPMYEVESDLGSTLMPKSGHWKLPFISYKQDARAKVESEVPELKDVE